MIISELNDYLIANSSRLQKELTDCGSSRIHLMEKWRDEFILANPGLNANQFEIRETTHGCTLYLNQAGEKILNEYRCQESLDSLPTEPLNISGTWT